MPLTFGKHICWPFVCLLLRNVNLKFRPFLKLKFMAFSLAIKLHFFLYSGDNPMSHLHLNRKNKFRCCVVWHSRRIRDNFSTYCISKNICNIAALKYIYVYITCVYVYYVYIISIQYIEHIEFPNTFSTVFFFCWSSSNFSYLCLSGSPLTFPSQKSSFDSCVTCLPVHVNTSIVLFMVTF